LAAATLLKTARTADIRAKDITHAARRRMYAIIGTVVVILAIVGGYLMEKGNLMVLVQPAELVIIVGAAAGTLLIANPLHILKQIAGNMTGLLKGSRYTHALYLDSLKMMYDLFNHARKEGMASVEADVENPDKSKVFSAYPAVMSDHHVRDFICDTMRTAAAGVLDPFDLDQMMDGDMEIHHHESTLPVSALNTVADSLPGLGIVAAVLGVVITMGALGGPPEEIGHKVAAALVGTFLGILLCYGFIGPMAANLAKIADEENHYYHVLRACMLSFIKGAPPIIAVEMGRRMAPGHVRPGFVELEKRCRAKGGAAAPAAPAAAA
jgi:chemotaxis protein MotA